MTKNIKHDIKKSCHACDVMMSLEKSYVMLVTSWRILLNRRVVNSIAWRQRAAARWRKSPVKLGETNDQIRNFSIDFSHFFFIWPKFGAGILGHVPHLQIIINSFETPPYHNVVTDAVTQSLIRFRVSDAVSNCFMRHQTFHTTCIIVIYVNIYYTFVWQTVLYWRTHVSFVGVHDLFHLKDMYISWNFIISAIVRSIHMKTRLFGIAA